MDVRTKDSEGLTICPECNKHYTPVLGERKTDLAIQVEFPTAKSFELEQIQTGICSNECWREFLNLDD